MKKLTGILLSVCLALSCAAAGAETVKHERVYVVLNAAGEVQSLTDSVRLENADGLETLTDRTGLTDVENVGGQEPFTLEGEVISFRADGKDIIYQGTSDRPVMVTPVVKVTVDGRETGADALRDCSGTVEIRVEYTQPEPVPCLAASLLLLPEEGISDLSLENAGSFSMSGMKMVAGWAVPGVSEKLKLPASFTVKFNADHAELKWMMTAATAEPISRLCARIERETEQYDPDQLLADAAALLTAMKDGAEFPETEGLLAAVPGFLTALNSSVTQLDDGAAALADGAGTLSSSLTVLASGIDGLVGGLNELRGKNSELNAGAEAVFGGLLQAANLQLQSSGLAAAGIDVPELTAEQFEEQLTALADQLTAAGDRIPGAQTALAQVGALKEQLTQAHAFVDGLKEYTQGVSKVYSSTALMNLQVPALDSGAQTLRDGAAQLQSEGTGALKQKLTAMERTAAEKLLDFVNQNAQDALDIYRRARDSAVKGAYDLRAEDGEALTVYIERTDF